MCAVPVLAYKPLIMRDKNGECHYSALQSDKKKKNKKKVLLLLLCFSTTGFFPLFSLNSNSTGPI